VSVDDPDAYAYPGRAHPIDWSGAVEVGWDPYLGTFFARDADGSPDPSARMLGFDLHGVPTVAGLAEALADPIPEAVAVVLTQDARRWPHKPVGLGPTNPGIEYTLAGPDSVRRVPGPYVPGLERQPDSRYRVQATGRTWWEVGWEPRIGQYEARQFGLDPETGAPTLLGENRGPDPAALAGVTVPAAVQRELAADRARFPTPDIAGVPNPGTRPSDGAPSEPSFEAWVAQWPKRQVPHIDFGTRWRDAAAAGPLRVSWVPTTGELYATDSIGSHVRVLTRDESRDQIDGMLAGWGEVGAGGDPQMSWVTSRIEEWRQLWVDLLPGGDASVVGADVDLATEPSPTTPPSSTDAELARLRAWEADLNAWQQRLTHQAQELAAGTLVGHRWTLPAGPAARAVNDLMSDAAFSTAEVEEFARGCNLDPQLAERLFRSPSGELNVEQIAQVCEALHCSPYDLWGRELGRSILHAYGPERWPRHIEPLDERLDAGPDNHFIRRRLDARAAGMAGPLTTALAENDNSQSSTDQSAPRTTIDVTCYRRTGIVAVGADGRVEDVSDETLEADATVDYHFRFRQMTESLPVDLPLSASEFATGPLPGFDAMPVLVDAASRIRDQSWLADTELVRFTDPGTGTDHWLGWDADAGAWQTWDDPRRYYPNDPNDVLDPGVFTTPQTTTTEGASMILSGDERYPDEVMFGPYADWDRGPIDPGDDEAYDDALDAYHAWLAGDRTPAEPEALQSPTLDL
jgi:hypothetical protein